VSTVWQTSNLGLYHATLFCLQRSSQLVNQKTINVAETHRSACHHVRVHNFGTRRWTVTRTCTCTRNRTRDDCSYTATGSYSRNAARQLVHDKAQFLGMSSLDNGDCQPSSSSQKEPVVLNHQASNPDRITPVHTTPLSGCCCLQVFACKHICMLARPSACMQGQG
jgi:hypothetical protein